MYISNLRIGFRLGLGFGAILALLVLTLGFGLMNMASLNDALLNVVNVNNVKADAATTMRDAQRQVAIAARNIALLTDVSAMAQQREAIRRGRDDYARASGILHRMENSVDGKTILSAIDAAGGATNPWMDRAIQLGLEGDIDQALDTLMKKVVPASDRWQAALTRIVDFQTELNRRNVSAAQAQYANAKAIMIAAGIIAAILGVLIAWQVTRSITGPLVGAVRIAQTVASGDLTSVIDVTSADETGQLLHALKQMNGSLTTIVGEVRAGTDTIAASSGQIAQGNHDLSARTEQQAGSLEETASSVEELTSTVRHNADNARQANQLAISASDVAVKGGAVVSQVVRTMTSINASATKIEGIISVIDGIAFQTNILALNAAVEAARAGEHGRGFAVVASEVRNLAHRSATAAKEIKDLIDDSVQKVGLGTRLVDEAGATMNNIVERVQQVSGIIEEIMVAGQEQAQGIEQINRAISHMDQVVQQNAALVEEAASAAEAMREQAENLVSAVSVFKIAPAGSHGRPQLRSLAGGATRDPDTRPVLVHPDAPAARAAVS